jgi:hypothetical protein
LYLVSVHDVIVERLLPVPHEELLEEALLPSAARIASCDVRTSSFTGTLTPLAMFGTSSRATCFTFEESK